jgi:hypothetical protein
MLANKLKCQMICSSIQISNPTKIYPIMNIINQGLKIHKHIILERGLDGTIHLIYIPFTNLDCCKKSHTNTSHNYPNLIKKCTASNNGKIGCNPSNILTLLNKHKLDLVEVIEGASNAMFMKRMRYSDNRHLTKLNMDIHLVLMFHNMLSFVLIIFSYLENLNILVGLWLK